MLLFVKKITFVPIVEPEIIMDGNHDIETCLSVTSSALNIVFEQLKLMNVYLERNSTKAKYDYLWRKL